MDSLPTPPPESIIYDTEKLYVCFALYPLTEGHIVVVWKDSIADLHTLARSDYEYLMDIVDVARNCLLELLQIEKVYLLYLDEVQHVHWHLVPRYNEKGFNVLMHTPSRSTSFPYTIKAREQFLSSLQAYTKTTPNG